MLYHLLYPLRDTLTVFNLFGYITFRAAMAAVFALAIGILVGPFLIRFLRRVKLGQPIRGEGIPDLYERHKGKQGTPTMGGLLIIASAVAGILLFGDLTNRFVILAMLITVALGALGAYDDGLKLFRKQYKGLNKTQKLVAQGLLGLAVGLYLYLLPPGGYGLVDPVSHKQLGTALFFPFFKNLILPLGLLYIPFVWIVLTSTSNAVNLTDGLDGLAIGCTTIAFFPFAVLAYVVGHFRFADYLNVPYVSGAGELAVFCAAFIGAGLAFLWYNAHPAEIFMGDTGSLALGGALGAVALLIKQELLLVIIGGIFVAEALSVVIQVFSFRVLKRRVFRMAPIHHHFEMLGLHEAKIIARFWIIGLLLGILGLSTLKIR